MRNSLTAVYRKTDDWVVAYVEEHPGANTQRRTSNWGNDPPLTISGQAEETSCSALIAES